MAASSLFDSAPHIPADAIYALTARYNNDPSPLKVNLGQGTYRDENGQPWVLPAVAAARKKLLDQGLLHEYLPILGLADFRRAACELVLGSGSPRIATSQVASCQSVSGTGALHLAALLIKRCSSTPEGQLPEVYISEPTWSNHRQLFASVGFECHSFNYYDSRRRSLDWTSYHHMLNTVKPGSIVILHACAHNPSGIDPTEDQWREIGQIMKKRELFPLFDAAYLGFNSGDLDQDAFAIRHFVNDLGLTAIVSVSFAKNMGLYGERTGCTIVATQSQSVAANVQTVLENIQRCEISTPPAFGAKIASTILNSSELSGMWQNDLITMSSRIRSMREGLFDKLTAFGAPGTWDHLVQQSGMFGFLSLPYEIVLQLRDEYSIYIADNSRISIAGLNESNYEYVAKSIAECLKKKQQQQQQQKRGYQGQATRVASL